MTDFSNDAAPGQPLIESTPAADFGGLSTALDRIRLRYFPVWALAVMVISVVVVQFLPVSFEASPGVLGGAMVVITIVGWMGWTVTRHRLHLSALFGPFPKRPVVWGTAAVMVVAVDLFQGAEFALLVPWLEDAAPLMADWYQVSAADDLPSGTWAYLTRTVPPVLVAPLVEEVFFRGLLYQRWARSWRRPRWALAASAVAFAAVHGHVVSSLLFAIVATLLYLQTRSLWVPVVFHSVGNGVVALGGLPITSGFEAVGIQAQQTVGVGCLVLALPLLGWFFWTHRSSLFDPLTYLQNLSSRRLRSSSEAGS